ncbi:HHL060Wp [Eremothecium sinecaudum]|uniref:Transcription factor STP1 n=1 Tax=Eremothecium sinecaudum TaxID=45286 RepID=A0A120K2V0_9SACH|nr:HHL060Wp [Eremothecium sinecaudum]AMD22710.1 HHL060Wp [Eremothecium sinecaudum]
MSQSWTWLKMAFMHLLDANILNITSFPAKLLSWFRTFAIEVTGETEASELVRLNDSTEVKENCEDKDFLELGLHEEEGLFGDTGSLFPERPNLDSSLNLGSSVCPCAIDLSTLQSPMSMSRSPDGNMEWMINTGSNLDSPSQTVVEEPLSPRNSSSTALSKEEEGQEGKDKFVCHYCDAEFRIRGYLTRHIKKHAVEKAYHCPYFNSTAPPETRCHTTGGFSRRDTYKTHLRSRHFIYPEGIKTQDRNKSPGHCAHCGKWFENTSKWIEKHIESGSCSGLPEGTILPAKSARKAGKLKMIKTSTGHSRFITTQQSVVEPKVLLNKEAIEAMQIVVNETNNSGQPALTKLSDNRIMLNSTNFKGDAKYKTAIKRQRQRRLNVGHNFVTPTPRTANESIIPVTTGSSSISAGQHLGGQVYHPMALSQSSTQYTFRTPDEAPLDEICLSINPSPAEDASLEPVRSASSLSSHDCNQNTSNDVSKLFDPINISNLANLSDSYYMPLDLEQISFTMPMEELSTAPQSHRYEEEAKINVTLNKQIDPIKLYEKQLRETQQYLNFYNYSFDTNL